MRTDDVSEGDYVPPNAFPASPRTAESPDEAGPRTARPLTPKEEADIRAAHRERVIEGLLYASSHIARPANETEAEEWVHRIEADAREQAATEARRELLAKVRLGVGDLPTPTLGLGGGVNRAAVLDLIESLAPSEKGAG
jgi:hypothetical protein